MWYYWLSSVIYLPKGMQDNDNVDTVCCGGRGQFLKENNMNSQEITEVHFTQSNFNC